MEFYTRFANLVSTLSYGNIKLARLLSENMRQDKALRESEGRFRKIVETAEEGICLMDHEWKTSYVNRRMEQILGYNTGEMLGRHIHEFMDEEGQRIAQDRMSEYKTSAQGTQDLKFIRRDGTELWTLLSSNPFINEGWAV